MKTKLLNTVEKSMPMTTYLNDDSQFNTGLDNTIEQDFNITIFVENRTVNHTVKGYKIDYFDGIETFWYINSNSDVVLTETKTGCSIYVISHFYFVDDIPDSQAVKQVLDLKLKSNLEITKEAIQKRINLFFDDKEQLKLLTGDFKTSI